MMGIYEWIDGGKITPDSVTADDVGLAADFLGRLEALSRHPEAGQFNSASEGCFGAQDIIGHIEKKLQKFQSCPDTTVEFKRLKIYLKQDFLPLFKEVLAWGRGHFRDAGFDQGLGANLRTLSPSDFGFHNALREGGGRIKFLDFEYFGWDDPAKMIVDFTFHPAMNLNFELKQDFYKRILAVFKHDSSLTSRVACYYPLLGLKWCLILLNEFLKDDLKRRQFAMADIKDTVTIQQLQLKKAVDLLLQVKSSYKEFPYGT
jgi:thiamine kinase-like enzyme